MNFEELREYVPGDDIKDIDWKATARSDKVLIRQYIAEKKHNIMFLMDTNCRMLADTQRGEEKRETAIFCAGTMAYLISRNGDYIGACYPTEESIQYFPIKTGLINVENFLQGYAKEVSKQNKSRLENAIEFVARNIRRSMIIVVITDIEGIRSLSESAVRRLLVMNDVLIMKVSDTSLTGRKVYDVEDQSYLPAFLSQNKKIKAMEELTKQVVEEECESKLKRAGIAVVTVDGKEGVDMQIAELISKHKMEKR
jgi:uncharacterized protein (DUF58 family)